MTAALTERDQLDDDLEELDPSEYDDDLDVDDVDVDVDDPAPLRRGGDRTKQQLRQTINAEHAATQAALMELVSKALAAKVAHDVSAHPIALEALDAFTATATALRAAITTEQQTIHDTEDPP